MVVDGYLEVLAEDDLTWPEDGMVEVVLLVEGRTCSEEDFPAEDELDLEDCHQESWDEEDVLGLLRGFCQILPKLVSDCCPQTPD